MHRLLIALLAALDAVIAAAGGIAIVLAPVTLLWVVGLGSGADWGALWPASGVIWQLGHLVPLAVTMPDTYLALSGIDPAGGSFRLSLAPLALAAFTALFAARSGRRAAQAGAAVTGPAAGTLVFAAVAVVVAITTANPIAAAESWQAILLPALVFGVPAFIGALVSAWNLEERGAIARLRTRVERWPGAWALVPRLIIQGTAIATAGLIGVGALAAGVAILVRGGAVVSLFEAAHVDVTGAVVLALAQLAYLPTLVVWGLAFVAGPGFALGSGTAVSPAGTQLGVVPGIPVLGAVPESVTPWLLLLALLPVGVGVLAGWMLRSRLASLSRASSPPFSARRGDDGGIVPRLVIAAAVAVLTGAVAALLAAVASGGIGPGRLAELGPHPGALALTVGTEILVGAAILLLLPRRTDLAETAADTASADPTASEDVRDRGATDAARTQAWHRLAAELSFTPAPHPTLATDPWHAPTGESLEADSSAGDPDATEPIPGLERRGGSLAHSSPAAPDPDVEPRPDEGATEPIPGVERERGSGAEPAHGRGEEPNGRGPGASVD